PRVKISGEGFDYSGRGSIPRAIFQFNRGADYCILEGFELSDAHNGSHNGAGVRINQANHVRVRNCNIHGNDMGIMSGGDGTGDAGANQRIDHCAIHHNGNFDHPGFNHNLYLGGASVTLSFCEIHSSLTGHNVKSRAHFTCVQYCYVHHSANREFDLVDSADTARPDSHAVLMGNVIVKDPECKGNRGLVHFGQDGGGEHDGAVHLVYNTIVDPFITPVVELSSPLAKALLIGNLVSDGGIRQNNQKIAGVRHGAKVENVSGRFNWFSGGFEGVGQTRLDPDTTVFQRVAAAFADPSRHDYRLTDDMTRLGRTRLSAEDLDIPWAPGMREEKERAPLAWQYRHPAGKEERRKEKTLTLGAYGR
ncbi:MAG: right-handed parallel beta-helix repeat-containing protein, partial [Planctomycetes bacterium]|nr:right-handed parallel beta-helix repeat-containing protein [Planctomycetota bacterium]